MNKQPNFLIGYGERLTEEVVISRGGTTPVPPYTFNEARSRVAPMVRTAVADLAAIPSSACPDDFAVALLTLHPQYTAKSYFPAQLLESARMHAIGSRPKSITPKKARGTQQAVEGETVELFVSARRSDLKEFATNLPKWTVESYGATDLFKVELFSAPTVEDRIIKPLTKEKEPLLEVVLHTEAQLDPGRIIEAFCNYVEGFGLSPDLDRRFEVGGLCFLPLRASPDLLNDLGKFAFLRVAREMPRLRQLRPMIRSIRKKKFPCELPQAKPINPQIRAAIFDGGIVPASALDPFATLHEDSGIGKAVNEFVDHGIAVTSALLFGPIKENQELPRPYGIVDHFRVLDEGSGTGPADTDLYDVLARIQTILQQSRYQFVNVSLGPRLPIEDTEVHAWTAVLDELLSDGDIVLTVAVGNDGDQDHESGNARVQVPSDLVNALAVGSADTRGTSWRRASYSCVGPGRSPGRTKPDVVCFGGTESEPFYVLDRAYKNAIPTQGTSLASPNTLRMAMAVRSHFDILSGLATKALLVHSAEAHPVLDSREIGWGRVPEQLDELVVCPEGIARVVYQGELTPGASLRMPIPLPSRLPECFVTMRATFCIASATDPQDPSNYTRSGLDIAFRPHSDKRGEKGVHAKTAPFFRTTDYDSEQELRHNAHKWETVMHAEKRMRSASLKDPVFDVRYQTRIAGKPYRGTGKISYALLVTVSIPKYPDLYNEVIRRYRTRLEPLRPVIEIPIRT